MSNDFSSFALFTAGLAAFTAVASAQQPPPHPPTINVGNPIYVPPKFAEVPVGSTYEITWDSSQKPAGCNKVSFLLLSGCPSNCIQEGDPIVTNLDNTGSYEWAVPASDAPDLPNQYIHGLQIICDDSGDFQCMS